MKQLLPLALLLIGLSSCYTDNYESLYPTGGCKIDSATYSGKVLPILTQNCALSGCHNTATAMSGVILDTYTGAETVAKSGKLVGAITHTSGFSPMPKDRTKLDDCTISTITKWVESGALND